MLRLGLSEVAPFITDRGRPYTDTPFVIPRGILKSSQPIGDDPNLCMDFVRYSHIVTIFFLDFTIFHHSIRSSRLETYKIRKLEEGASPKASA